MLWRRSSYFANTANVGVGAGKFLGMQKDFCPNFLKLDQKIFGSILGRIFSILDNL